MHPRDYEITVRLPATVVSTERITPDNTDEVRELVLDIEADAFTAKPGQSVGVLTPGVKEHGRDHLRLYTLADLPETTLERASRLRICVRRCTHVDPVTSEEIKGVASNYLCDLKAGDTVTLCGPYGLAFDVPAEQDANLVLIGAGTGIAPFRAFLKHLYGEVEDFRGHVRLFHGARSGLDAVYMNDIVDDFSQYYDTGTFEAIAGLSAPSHWSRSIDWVGAVEARGEQLWEMLSEDKTYVYLAGLDVIRDELDTVLGEVVGSEKAWLRHKADLAAVGRWVELLY